MQQDWVKESRENRIMLAGGLVLIALAICEICCQNMIMNLAGEGWVCLWLAWTDMRVKKGLSAEISGMR